MPPKDDLTGIEEYSKDSQSTSSAPQHGNDHDLFPTNESQAADSAAVGELAPALEPAPEPAIEEDLPDLSQNFSGNELESPSGPADLEIPSALDAPAEQENHALDNVRRYSERITAKTESVPAAYPFSLLIEGHLRPEEKEKLLDLLARAGMGIREVDLEPQFESGRVLIPRISEYAAVLLIQGLRGIRAKIKAGPSDEIYSTPDTRAEKAGVAEPQNSRTRPDGEHPAESLPITGGPSIPWIPNYKMIGVLTASATLKSTSVETENSSEYLELLESLQRELRYRALHKGAIAILNYTIQLTPLQLSSHYRVSVSGTAIKS